MKLGVNIDHVATLRQARGGMAPDPVDAAKICKRVGAHAVVMHLREDRRHIQDQDLFRVQKTVDLRLNLEMSIAPSVLVVAKRLAPPQVTLVPERRQERTTEGGLDLLQKTERVRRAVDTLKQRGAEVSLFIDPDLKQVDMAKKIGADSVEFHTGDYANQYVLSGAKGELVRLKKAATHASHVPLHVYAGHGLDYQNVPAVLKIPSLEELNIGYSIVTRALWVGLETAVSEMLDLIAQRS
jgi:pyridoxine 5-phosphate synthase